MNGPKWGFILLATAVALGGLIFFERIFKWLDEQEHDELTVREPWDEPCPMIGEAHERVVEVDGTAWCSKCGLFLPAGDFDERVGAACKIFMDLQVGWQRDRRVIALVENGDPVCTHEYTEDGLAQAIRCAQVG